MDWEAKKRCRAFYNLLVNLYPWLESEELVAAGAARWGRGRSLQIIRAVKVATFKD